MILLYKIHPDTYDREVLGNITEAQLDFLANNLEQEFEDEEEFFLNPETLQFLKEKGADSGLVSIFEKALIGAQEGVEIFYTVE